MNKFHRECYAGDDVVARQMAVYGNARRGVSESDTPVVLSKEQRQKCYDVIEKAGGKEAVSEAMAAYTARR